jgi:hypothetical protein
MKRISRNLLWCLSLLGCLTLAGQSQVDFSEGHVGRVVDWSYHHIVVSGPITNANLDRARREPRILFHLAERNLPATPSFSGKGNEAEPNISRFGFGRGPGRGGNRPGSPAKKSSGLQRDWSVSLGAGTVAQNMFPAKFGLNPDASITVANCASDYIVYGLNVAGSGSQANLVGIKNLYSGTGGLCGATPTVNWAYDGTAGGKILTSTVISIDGTQIAYVESGAASSIFHVLTWKAGQGTSATSAVTPTAAGSCTTSTSCLRSLTYSTTATDTLSSPWVDYATDKAFVGSDDGKIYRISCVFKCLPNANPTVDWTFTLPVKGTGGSLATPNGPVYDSDTNRLFVGDQLGELWTLNVAVNPPVLFAGPVMIGGGNCSVTHPPGRTGTGAGGNCTANGGSFGIPDPVLLDSSSDKIFAFSGNDGTNGASAVVAQLNEDLTGPVKTHVGRGSRGTTSTDVNLYSGAFDNDFFGTAPNTGQLYLCGTSTADTSAFIYWIGFISYPTMNSASSGNITRGTAAGEPCSPITEIFNPNVNFGAGDHDIIISSVLGAGNDGFIRTDDISTGTVTGTLASAAYDGGTSGIIWDNTSTQTQASSVYFSTLGTSGNGSCPINVHCAVKLTQSGLN